MTPDRKDRLRRAMSISLLAFQILAFDLIACTGTVIAQPLSDINFRRVGSAVVIVDAEPSCGGGRSHGFFVKLGGQLRVVATAHGVGQCTTVSVQPSAIQGVDVVPRPAIAARVERLSTQSDLSILVPLSALPAQTFIDVAAAATASTTAPLYAVGFLETNGRAMTKPLTLTHGNHRVRDVLGDAGARELRRAGMRIADLTILLFDGNLAPGSSGAPVVNGTGAIVGVVEGGLSMGDAGTCWAVPIDNVGKLFQGAAKIDVYTAEERAHFRRMTRTLFGNLALEGEGSFADIQRRGSAQGFLSLGIVGQGQIDQRFDLHGHFGFALSAFIQFLTIGPHSVDHAFGMRLTMRVLPFGGALGAYRAPNGDELEGRSVSERPWISLGVGFGVRFNRLRDLTWEIGINGSCEVTAQQAKRSNSEVFAACGGGLSLRIAKALSGHHAIGIEVSPSFQLTPSPSRFYTGAGAELREATYMKSLGLLFGAFYEY